MDLLKVILKINYLLTKTSKPRNHQEQQVNIFFQGYSDNKQIPKIKIENDDNTAEIEIKKENKLIYVHEYND